MRRNDLDICADLLKVAMNGAKKTQLVYKANLNFNILKKYIKRLTDNELITLENGHFFTTDKGSNFLARYLELIEPLSVLQGTKL